MQSRQYGRDVLAPENRKPRPGQRPVEQVEAEPGLVVEDFEGRFCGAVVALDNGAVTLEDRHGKRRVFPVPGPFLLDGKRVTLVRPRPAPAANSAISGNRTASGSIAAPQQRAKVAKASRIYVEGKHDAELVEKIWGDDLRDVGVVVEYLEGVDDLPAIVDDFQPGRGQRLGVLVDHLVAGSKESRIAAAVARDPARAGGRPPVHRHLGGGQARRARPARRGRTSPGDSRGRKACWRGSAGRTATPQDVAVAWRRILRAVTSYADLEPELLGRVEELIDFVTEPEAE